MQRFFRRELDALSTHARGFGARTNGASNDYPEMLILPASSLEQTQTKHCDAERPDCTASASEDSGSATR